VIKARILKNTSYGSDLICGASLIELRDDIPISFPVPLSPMKNQQLSSKHWIFFAVTPQDYAAAHREHWPFL
jgi:hypothetical protein